MHNTERQAKMAQNNDARVNAFAPLHMGVAYVSIGALACDSCLCAQPAMGGGDAEGVIFVSWPYLESYTSLSKSAFGVATHESFRECSSAAALSLILRKSSVRKGWDELWGRHTKSHSRYG